jgi:hypothetical protein
MRSIENRLVATTAAPRRGGERESIDVFEDTLKR